jgi:hypothetical protein
MKSVGELRDEIAEHVACSWKAVQQKEGRSVRATGLPVEDFDAADAYTPVSDFSHLSGPPTRGPAIAELNHRLLFNGHDTDLR